MCITAEFQMNRAESICQPTASEIRCLIKGHFQLVIGDFVKSAQNSGASTSRFIDALAYKVRIGIQTVVSEPDDRSAGSTGIDAGDLLSARVFKNVMSRSAAFILRNGNAWHYSA